MTLNKSKLALLITGFLLLQTSCLVSAIEVFPIVKEIKSDTPRENFVTVKSNYLAKETVPDNKSENKQYEFVTMELLSVTNPGAKKEILEKELGKADPVMVFSPTRLVVPYGESRKVRLMPLKPVQREKVYRLRIRPSYPEQALEKGKVRFAIGYDVLLRYLPEGKAVQGVAVKCAGKQWTFSATGNVRSEMRNLVVDGRKAETNFNVYPDYDRSLTVNRQLTFEMDNQRYTYEHCSLKE